MQVVGVVEDLRQQSPIDQVVPEVFVDYRQLLQLQERWQEGARQQNEATIGFLSFALRTDADPRALTAPVSSLVRSVDPNIGIDALIPLRQLEAASVARERLYAVVLALFAGVAAVLALIGIYGVLAYAVAERTQEIGVRMALGARSWQVHALILSHGLILTTVGLTIGLALAAGATEYLEALLFGIRPLDVWTFAAVALMFSAVATAAAFIPARTATRIEPMVALRRE